MFGQMILFSLSDSVDLPKVDYRSETNHVNRSSVILIAVE